MICSHIDKNFNELKNVKRGSSYLLAVMPEERKKGFGKALTAASLRWIAEQGMRAPQRKRTEPKGFFKAVIICQIDD